MANLERVFPGRCGADASISAHLVPESPRCEPGLEQEPCRTIKCAQAEHYANVAEETQQS